MTTPTKIDYADQIRLIMACDRWDPRGVTGLGSGWAVNQSVPSSRSEAVPSTPTGRLHPPRLHSPGSRKVQSCILWGQNFHKGLLEARLEALHQVEAREAVGEHLQLPRILVRVRYL